MEETTELTVQLSSAIEQLMGYVKAGADMAAEQMPLVAQEIVAKQIWLNGYVAVFCVVLVIAGTLLVRLANRMDKKPDSETDAAIAGVSGCIMLAVGVIGIHVNIYRVISALVAPRLLVLEKLSDLIQ